MRRNKALAAIILSIFILILFPVPARAEGIEEATLPESEELTEEPYEELPAVELTEEEGQTTEEEPTAEETPEELPEVSEEEGGEEEIILDDIIVDKLRDKTDEKTDEKIDDNTEDKTDNKKAGEKISPAKTKKYRELPETGEKLNVPYLCGLLAGMLGSLAGAITFLFYGIKIMIWVSKAPS